MADATLRLTERRWTETKTEGVATLQRLRDVGAISDAALELAACLGHDAAAVLFGRPAPRTTELSPAARTVLDQQLARRTFAEREMVKLSWGCADGNAYSADEIGRVFKREPAEVRQTIERFRAETRERLVLGDLLEIALEPPTCGSCGHEGDLG